MSRSRWPRRMASAALIVWGLVHLYGGGAEIVVALGDDASEALDLIGTGAADGDIPVDAGPVAAGVIAFHGFLIAAMGAAVLGLVATRPEPTGLAPALGIMAVADAGLIAFLVAPGHMAPVDAVPGPALLVAGAAAAWWGGWRPGSTAGDADELVGDRHLDAAL